MSVNTIDLFSNAFSSLTTYAMLYESIKECSSSNPVSSDGFVLDDSPPVVGVVYNTGHHNDVIYQSAFNPVQILT
jgi:hypothetical protein